MTVKCVPFHPRHLEVFEARGREKVFVVNLEDIAKNSIQAGTFISDGRIIFIGGFYQLWPGLLDFWMIPSIYVEHYPLAFSRILKRYVENIADTFKAHRVQTTSYDDPMHERFMGFLGFRKEGILVNYLTDRTSMAVYARLF